MTHINEETVHKLLHLIAEDLCAADSPFLNDERTMLEVIDDGTATNVWKSYLFAVVWQSLHSAVTRGLVQWVPVTQEQLVRHGENVREDIVVELVRLMAKLNTLDATEEEIIEASKRLGGTEMELLTSSMLKQMHGKDKH